MVADKLSPLLAHKNDPLLGAHDHGGMGTRFQEQDMKIKVSEAKGLALDWLVAKCEGFDAKLYEKRVALVNQNRDTLVREWSPSTDWAQGGPIIDREQLAIWFQEEFGGWHAATREWMEASVLEEFLSMPEARKGPTSLIAAMRSYAAAKLGDEAEVPDELLEN